LWLQPRVFSLLLARFDGLQWKAFRKHMFTERPNSIIMAYHFQQRRKLLADGFLERAKHAGGRMIFHVIGAMAAFERDAN
jgi:hypothetical protein